MQRATKRQVDRQMSERGEVVAAFSREARQPTGWEEIDHMFRW
jgi:hypothetical protein